MKKAKMHTPNLTQENIARIRELFPNCVTEVKDPEAKPGDETTVKYAIDFDLLKQELSEQIVEGPVERYHLNWPGKREALLAANAPIAKTLRPARDESVNFDTTQNLFIEGDNLDALKLLQETYLGKVKMIYIDPPYNTGNDFIYDDDFAESSEEYLTRSLQKDEEGNRLVTNSESNGRFHSDWLSMMYPRLKLARNLLRDDGVIFISIDDGEVHNLRKVCDEVFGEANFIATLVWEKGRKNDAKRFSVGHDYILAYARHLPFVDEIAAPWREPKAGLTEIVERYEQLKRKYDKDFKSISEGLVAFYRSLPKGHPSKAFSRSRFVDFRGIWRDNNISWPGGGGPKYELLHPTTGRPCKVPEDGWRFVEDTMQEKIAAGYVEFREDHTKSPFLKSYLYVDPQALDNSSVDAAGEKQQVMGSVFYRHTQPSNDVIKNLFGQKMFNNPKDHVILQRLIGYCTGPKDLVLDFFAGSASLGHACFGANRQDDGNRKFILVQLAEECDSKSEAAKAGYSTIADIAKERIRRAGKKIVAELSEKPKNKSKDKENGQLELSVAGTPDVSPTREKSLDIGFRVLKIDSSCMADVYYSPDQTNQENLFELVENIKPDRTEEDLLFQVLLDWGVDLTLPIVREKIEKQAVFFVDRNALAACFVKDGKITEKLVEKIAERQPLRVVFRDAGFKGDSVRINVEQIFKQKSPGTEIRII